jgi:hypothetical protein
MPTCARWSGSSSASAAAVDYQSRPCHGGRASISLRKRSAMENTAESGPASSECPDCHALTANLEAHKHWHSRLVHDIATAVDKDIDRRTHTS